MADLPESTKSVAYHARNGELAWRRDEVPRALAAIGASGQAVLGGEVWVILDHGSWTGLVPDRNGGPDGVWTWSTNRRTENETWHDYCIRTAKESERIVAEMRVEEEADPSLLGKLYFNFTYIPESDV